MKSYLTWMRVVRDDRRHHASDQAANCAVKPVNKWGRIFYAFIGFDLLLYVADLLALSTSKVGDRDLLLGVYYAADYAQGFVRRGLAGQILDLFPSDSYFTGLTVMRWLVPVLFIASISMVMWVAAVSAGFSERRLMLALLIPLLPFGFARALSIPIPDLLGEAALAVFAVVLASVKKDRSIVFLSAAYGMAAGLLTLIHEAIPFLNTLGAVLAIVVLEVPGSVKVQRLSALLAVAPALVIALAIALLGRRDESSRCIRLPHKVLSQTLNGKHITVDYHDRICRLIKIYGWNFTDNVRFTAGLGAFNLTKSMLLGVVACVATILLIADISGVPFGRFCNIARGQLFWVFSAAVLVIPIFLAGDDWVRWWVAISFDVGLAYLLLASGRPESAEPPSWRTRVTFVLGMALLGLLPVGTIGHIGPSQIP